MFNRTVLASVGLPKGVWEPLRKLNDVHGVGIVELADAFGITPREMLKVLYAGRLTHLDKGEEVAWLEELGDGRAPSAVEGS